MREEEEQEKEMDPLSRLMFGGRSHNRRNDSEGVEDVGSDDREYDWLLGRRRPITTKEEETPSEGIHHKIGEMLQNIDYIEAMKHVDTLMTSANELKPLLGKVKPLIESFTQKK